MLVERCICHKVSFAQLWAMVQAGTTTLEELSAKTGCCTGCGLCRDYVRLMLLTGKTAFPPMHPDTLARTIRLWNQKPPTPPTPPSSR